MQSTPSFSIVIVSYYSNIKIFDLYETIPKHLEIIIVDNSNDHDLKLWSQNKSNVNLISLEKNIGFGSACNLGVSFANSDWIFFLNPDCIVNSDLASGFESFLNSYPNAKSFAPFLQDENNTHYYKNKCIFSNPKKIVASQDKITQVPFLSGAALFVLKSAFDSINGFDPKIFLFFEDDDLTYRLHLKYQSNFLTPNIKILHIGGQSSPGLKSIDFIKKYYWGKSEFYIMKKYKGILPAIIYAAGQCVKLISPNYLSRPRKLKLQLYKIWGILNFYYPLKK